ncbi:hypothetical protein HHI36_008872 [Cryptolaemus montrouzieri]|uniref:superoxide dismutase n=1 Tax=Cryptolaemus montrouzieri TaxID=559131 RepID=A0ABD2MTR8_9CUCU
MHCKVYRNLLKISFQYFLYLQSYNKSLMKHGKRDDEVRHIGDLGNILSNEEKKAEESFFDKHISFKGETNIIGKVLVVHADADDYGRGTFADSPITGNSGEKIACGIIERSSSPRHLATVLAIFLPILILTIRN